jgi:hypothetical protein
VEGQGSLEAAERRVKPRSGQIFFNDHLPKMTIGNSAAALQPADNDAQRKPVGAAHSSNDDELYFILCNPLAAKISNSLHAAF